MASIVYRNREGILVDVAMVTATDLKSRFGAVFEQTIANGLVAITRHAQPKAVLLSYAEFEALTRARAGSLDALTREFDDALLARMQKPAAKKGMAAAFDAPPAKLGQSAARAAKKRR